MLNELEEKWNRACDAESAGEFAAAASLLHEIVSESPDFHPARTKLGMVLESQDQAQAAAAAYRDAIRHAPQNRIASRRLAALLLAMFRADGDEAHIEEALGLLELFAHKSDTRSDVAVTAAEILSEAGRLREAKDYLRQALQRLGEDRDLLEGLAECAELARDFDTLKESLEKLITLDAENGSLHTRLASVLAKRGQYSQAQQSIETALRLDPKNPWAWLTQAAVSSDLGEHKAAAQSYLTAVGCAPNDVWIRAHAAKWLRHIGESDLAAHIERGDATGS